MSSPRNPQFDYEYSNLELDPYDLKESLDLNLAEFHNYYDEFHQHFASASASGADPSAPPPLPPSSLTDNMSLARAHHHNVSISSVGEMAGRLPTSDSMESIPPLTASGSHHSLSMVASFQLHARAESAHDLSGSASMAAPGPSSALNPPHPQLHQVANTPGKLTRNKSLSVGSYNLSTPLRSNTSPSSASTSSTNAYKVSKTPYRHSRSLSRNRVDRTSLTGLNPFYTPNSFVSPKYTDLSFDNDDLQTPMQSENAHHALMAAANLPNFNLQFTSPSFNPKVSPTLRRQNTLDSIKIEDQDDDAFKQLKRAKSSTSIRTVGQTFYQAQSTSFSHDLNHQALPPTSAQAAASLATPSDSKNISLLQSQFNPLKSYPASINLSSIAADNRPNPPGLLPPLTSIASSAPASVSGPSASSPHHSASMSAPASAGLTPLSLSMHHPHQHSASMVQPPHQLSPASLQQAKEINPSFVPDLPIKITDKASSLSDPKKKHACPLCYARFHRPEHVKRHMKSHSSEKPFECDQPNCNKRFNRKDNLKAHLKKIHSII
ncbi:hypothetical protein PSN45_000511 [Yamadazyma tenuis]|nr:hypothetical protein PSN45_000511 [Yamadazyma tenuis]